MSTLTTPHIDVHRGGDRMKTRVSWLDSKHSFSFGEHYDPDNTHLGCCSSITKILFPLVRASKPIRIGIWRS